MSLGVRHRHWTQAYSLDKLLHSSCLCDALGARVTGRTRIISKRRIFLYPSQTVLADASKHIGLKTLLQAGFFLHSLKLSNNITVIHSYSLIVLKETFFFLATAVYLWESSDVHTDSLSFKMKSSKDKLTFVHQKNL